MTEPNHEVRVPFSAALLQSKNGNLETKLAALAPFGEVFAEKVSVLLSDISSAPVKASLSATRHERLRPQLQAEAGYDMVSTANVVSCWMNPARDFDDLICEMILGGSGANGREAEHDRPLSTFDKKLHALLCQKLTQTAADALCELGELNALLVQPRARIPVRKVGNPVRCYVVKLLINAFDSACEFEIYMDAISCMKLMGVVPEHDGLSTASPNSMLEQTAFPVDVYLSPCSVDVRSILNLTTGEVLKLNVPASSPVELRLNGRKITSGKISFDDGGGRIRLIQDTSFRVNQEVAHTHAGHHGN